MAEVEESIQNQRLEDILRSNDLSNVPSTKELLKMLETSDIPEEMKENLKTMLTGNVPRVFGNYESMLAILFVLIITLVILFFGYKLYKSIKEKEVKREEKKKAKVMKKKK